MSSVRILHTADWHLGKENSYLGALSNNRKYEIKATVLRMISLCEENDVDLLLIAGDLFENNRIENETVDSVLDALGQLTRTKVVIALGNHDPLTADSPFKTKTPAKNIFILPENDYVINFDSLNCRVYGSSFGSVYKTGSDKFFITPPDDDKINIMVLHGETKSDLSSSYRSVTKNFIEESKMDYIALGHNHKRSEIVKLGSTHFAYCGCIEGQGYDEDGDKGVYLGDISKAECNLQFVKLAKRTHHCFNVDLSGKETADTIVLKAIKEASENYGDDLFRITLTGEIEKESKVNINDISAKVSPYVYALRLKDKTTLKADLDTLANENSLKGRFVSEMLKRISEAEESEKELYQNALQIGLKSFDGQVNYGED